jgi:hypothetical protein
MKKSKPSPEIPKLPPFVTNGGGRYLCTYESHWDKALKQPRRTSTKTVGKLIPAKGREGVAEVLFKDEFVKLHPWLEQLRVFRHKGGRLEFMPKDGGDGGIGELSLEQCLSVRKIRGGASWALSRLAENSPIGRALASAFPRGGMDRRLLSLAIFSILSGSGSVRGYSDFARSEWLPWQKPMSASAIVRIFREATEEQTESLFECLRDELRKSCGNGGAGRTYLILDTSSAFSQVCELPQGLLPRTNVLLVVDGETGIPVCLKRFEGKAPDLKAVRETVEECRRMKLPGDPKFVLVADRRGAADPGFGECRRLGIGFVFRLSLDDGSAAAKAAEENSSRLADWNSTDPYLGRAVATVPFNFGLESGRSFIHLFFDRRFRQDASDILEDSLCRLAAEFNSKPGGLSPDEKKLVERLCDIAGGRASISMSKAGESLKFAGVSALASSGISDAASCFLAYQERCRAEEAFCRLQICLGSRRGSVYEPTCFEGKLQVQVLAAAICGIVRRRMEHWSRETRKGKSWRIRFDSEERLLSKLDGIMLTRFGNGWHFGEMSEKERELFEMLDVCVPDRPEPAAIAEDDDGEEGCDMQEEEGDLTGTSAL